MTTDHLRRIRCLRRGKRVYFHYNESKEAVLTKSYLKATRQSLKKPQTCEHRDIKKNESKSN